MLIVCRYDFGTPAYDEAIALRDEVLRRPLSMSITDDDIAAEIDQHHIGLFDSGRLLGTVTLRANADGSLQMRQVAVLAKARGNAVGLALVRYCEAFAKTYGAPQLYCHARESARGFYHRCGWAPFGKTYVEVGLPHINMRSAAIG